jgi:hypothetical protein
MFLFDDSPAAPLFRRGSRRPVFALAAGLVLASFLCPGATSANPCSSPPPPRFLPGQVDHYPNGADVITCTEPTPGHEAWHIEYPSVERSLTDYPAIAFNPGDVVRLSASGCVQSGGFGQTWKRYVDPDDGDGHLDSQYYGTVQIRGVTGDNNPQSIKHWVGPPFIVPLAGHLALGYVDDGGIGDNGYWSHDDGTNNQCVGLSKAVVDVVVDRHAAHLLDCKKIVTFTNTPVAPEVPELARVATLLTTRAEAPVGLPITVDAQGTGITHFQLYQDGKRGDRTTKSNRPLNSAEMHADRCIYFAYTPTTSPIWYPADLAFDKSPQSNWQARPWDIPRANVGFFDLEALNRDPASWLPTFLPGYCSGAGTRGGRALHAGSRSARRVGFRRASGRPETSRISRSPRRSTRSSRSRERSANGRSSTRPTCPMGASTSTIPSGGSSRTRISAPPKER